MRIVALVVFSFLAAALTGCATDNAKPEASAQPAPKWHPVPPSPEELSQITQIIATGREIYRRDQLVWHASDAFAATQGHPTATEGGGYAITESPAGVRVAFLQDVRGTVRVLGDVDMTDPSKPKVDISPARAPDEQERVLLRARETALRSAPDLCGGARNTVTLPRDNGTWDVYVLAASSNAAIVPVGGHARVNVSTDGSAMLALEPYAKSCIESDTSKPHLVALMSTHIVSDLPAPTHVYTSLVYPRTLMIVTKTHLWRVADGNISAAN